MSIAKMFGDPSHSKDSSLLLTLTLYNFFIIGHCVGQGYSRWSGLFSMVVLSAWHHPQITSSQTLDLEGNADVS